MRHDLSSSATTSNTGGSTSSLPRTAVGPRARTWAGPLVLGVLTAITSLAVASYASVWLVPPYLVVIALIVGPPTSRRPAGFRHGSIEAGEPGSTTEATNTTSAHAEAEDASSEAESDQERSFDTSLLEAKRARSRRRKAKPGSEAEPTSAMWVRVGPGKFVRADSASSLATSGDGAETTADDQERVPALEKTAEKIPEPRLGGRDASDHDAGVEQGADLGEGSSEANAGSGDDGVGPVVGEEYAAEDHGIAPEAPADVSISDDSPSPSNEVAPEISSRGPRLETDLGEEMGSSDDDICPSESMVSEQSSSLPTVVRSSRRWLRAFAFLSDRRAIAGRPSGPAWRTAGRRKSAPVLSSPRRSSERHGRGQSRFHRVDRAHPPRSPPRGEWSAGGLIADSPRV